MVKKVTDGFDPQNNEKDRRMLFEVTGMRLLRDEFQGEDGSDSDGVEVEELLPSDFAMMDRFFDEDEPDDATET